MQCARCQQDNPPQAKFCLECGSRLVRMCTQRLSGNNAWQNSIFVR